MLRPLIVAASCCFLFACGPALTITSPGEDLAVVVPTDGKVEITVEVPNFTLLPAGECGDRESCGHLRVELLLGDTVGSSATGTPCAGPVHLSETTFSLDLADCSRQTGEFGVFVGLEDDAHHLLEVTGTSTLRFFKIED